MGSARSPSPWAQTQRYKATAITFSSKLASKDTYTYVHVLSFQYVFY